MLRVKSDGEHKNSAQSLVCSKYPINVCFVSVTIPLAILSFVFINHTKIKVPLASEAQ